MGRQLRVREPVAASTAAFDDRRRANGFGRRARGRGRTCRRLRAYARRLHAAAGARRCNDFNAQRRNAHRGTARADRPCGRVLGGPFRARKCDRRRRCDSRAGGGRRRRRERARRRRCRRSHARRRLRVRRRLQSERRRPGLDSFFPWERRRSRHRHPFAARLRRLRAGRNAMGHDRVARRARDHRRRRASGDHDSASHGFTRLHVRRSRRVGRRNRRYAHRRAERARRGALATRSRGAVARSTDRVRRLRGRGAKREARKRKRERHARARPLGAAANGHARCLRSRARHVLDARPRDRSRNCAADGRERCGRGCRAGADRSTSIV